MYTLTVNMIKLHSNAQQHEYNMMNVPEFKIASYTCSRCVQ